MVTLETRVLFGNFFGNNRLISLKKNFRSKFPNDVILSVMHLEKKKMADSHFITVSSSSSNGTLRGLQLLYYF